MSATPWDLDELRRLEKEATAGPWTCHSHTWVAAKTDLAPGDSGHGLLNNFDARDRSDAALIVALRNAAAAGMLERIAELEVTSKSAAAYGLPATYRAAVEEVHEWREAAEEGAMTPSGLHKRLASDGRHHDEHHARQVELELRIAKLERELKSVQEYAAVAHQNGLDTYQAERTALLERIAELEADFARIERLDAALAVEELAAEANAARAMAVMRAAEQYCKAHRDRSPGGEVLLRERYAALEDALAPSTPGPATGALAQGSRLWRCAEALATARDQLARQDAECNRLVAAVRE